MDATVARIQRAIAHIEKNLLDPLPLNDVALASGLSIYHLHRLFTAVLGHSIKGYIRKRRLTVAATLLRTTNRTVLDIALTCRFESQASFTRAFRSFFGVPPGRYRDKKRSWYPGLAPASLESLEHLRRDALTREPVRRRVEQPIAIAGIAIPVDLDAELRILELWGELVASIDLEKAADVTGYGVALAQHPDVALGADDSLVYLGGVEHAASSFRAPPPHRCTIPSGDYVVFEHRGSPDEIPATVDYVWGTWLPKSGLEKSARPDFERTRLAAMATGDFSVEIWVSVGD